MWVLLVVFLVCFSNGFLLCDHGLDLWEFNQSINQLRIILSVANSARGLLKKGICSLLVDAYCLYYHWLIVYSAHTLSHLQVDTRWIKPDSAAATYIRAADSWLLRIFCVGERTTTIQTIKGISHPTYTLLPELRWEKLMRYEKTCFPPSHLWTQTKIVVCMALVCNPVCAKRATRT